MLESHRLIAVALLLTLTGACGGPAVSTPTEKNAAHGIPFADGEQRPADSLVISLADYDFSEDPGLRERILASPHSYFRFINRRFARAVCRRFEDELSLMPAVNLHGDAHLENYSVTERQRGLADFDDASAGPFVIDMVRFGVSLHLASRQLGWESQADAMVADFIEGYRIGLQFGDHDDREPALATRIRAGLAMRRLQILAAAEALMEPLGEAGRDFERALQQYKTQMREDHPDLPMGFFRVKAMGRLNLGIGSAFSEKYLMRVEGPTDEPGDDMILEAKAIGILDNIDCIQRPKAEVARITIAQARLAFEPPRYVGAVTLHPDLGFQRRQKFWVQAWEDNYVQLVVSRSFRTPQDLFDIARDVGFQLGRGQPKSIADPYEAKLRRALLVLVSRIEPDITAAIDDLTRQTIAAWRAVRRDAGLSAGPERAAAANRDRAGDGIDLVFKVDNQVITFAGDQRAALIDQADSYLRSCNVDAGDVAERVWREALDEASSVHLSYATPIRSGLPRREVLISEAVFSIWDQDSLGLAVLHDAGRTTRVTKCSGSAMFELVCMPELAAYVRSDHRSYCAHLRAG